MRNREFFNQLWQNPYRKKLRNHSTYTEVLFWNRIKGRKVGGLKFRRQHGIGKYIVDFYCPEIKLAIELDGLIHNTVESIACSEGLQLACSEDLVERIHEFSLQEATITV
jgi:hypothetical protein